MLFERVEKFYDEFEKVLSLARRKGQRIGSAFFSLPLYGEVTTVVGEGQTGMGKTLSYLVPIAMYRSGVLPEVPSFILKHGNNLFLEKKSLEDIIVEHDLIEESDTILKNTKTPVLGKIYILTATKMLQNQIINNDLEKVNKFLKEKNLLPISHMVLIGKKNYICLSNVENLVEKVSEIESEVENELEEAVKSSNNVLLEELKNQIKVVREVKRKLSTILQERISTFDELLKFFKRRELEVLGEEIEEVLEWGKIRSIRQSAFEIISPPFFFYKDKAMFYVHEVTSINEFISFLKKGYSSIIRKGMVDELFSTEFFSKCRACVSEKKESCEFFKSIESLRRADVLITNYYYFAVVLSEILSGLKRTIQQMEKTIGLSVNKWGQNTLKKALLPYEEEFRKMNFSIEKAIEVLMWYKGVYEKYYKNALFIFDEAHVFERDILMAGVRSVDFKELEKKAKNLRKKLAEISNIIELPSLPSHLRSTAEVNVLLWEKDLASASEESYQIIATFHSMLSKTIEEMKTSFKNKEESITADTFLVFMAKSLADLVNESKDNIYTKLLKKGIEDVVSNLIKCYEKMHFQKLSEERVGDLKKSLQSILFQKFLSLKEVKNYVDLGSIPISTKIVSIMVTDFILREIEKGLLGSVNKVRYLADTDEVKRGKPSLLTSNIALRRFPVSRVLNFCNNYLDPLIEISRNGAFERALNNLKKHVLAGKPLEGFEFLKDFVKREDQIFSLLEHYTDRVETNLNKVVFFDGLKISEMSETVNDFLKRHFPDWANLRKVFTSATLATGYTNKEPDFSFFLRSVGIRSSEAKEKTKVFLVTSPFDYRNNALFYLPQDIPPLKDENGGGTISEKWKHYVRDKLKEVVFYTKGGVLVLTTSDELVYFLKESLSEFFEKEGVELFVQGYTPIKEIQKRFGKVDPEKVKQVLIAGPLFWQGFDVPGEGLTHVILTKLPFFEPNNPYNVMLTRREYNSLVKFFLEKKGYSLEKASQLAESYVFKRIIMPFAVLQFRQGVGRLIRTETDKGLVTCFDDRLISKKYGEQFAQMLSMPFTRNEEEVFKFLEKVRLIRKDQIKNKKKKLKLALASV